MRKIDFKKMALMGLAAGVAFTATSCDTNFRTTYSKKS